jgi:hypothetical protein
MNILKTLVLVFVSLTMLAFLFACATVTPSTKVEATVTAKTGDIVHLFHGGNKLAKDEFCPDETVTVYRYFGSRWKEAREVGKVKITQYLGDHFIEGKVVEGSLKSGDVAIKPNSACMIRVPEPEK